MPENDSERSLMSNGGDPISDPDVLRFLNKIDIPRARRPEAQNEFSDDFFRWLHDSSFNSLMGAKNFKRRAFSMGTTQSFDDFYLRHARKRFRIFRGEYLYHRAVWACGDIRWQWIESESLEPGDALILSYPFSATGNPVADLDSLMRKCSALKIPVLLDLAYWPAASDLSLDVDFPCVEMVTFSLSKALGVGHLRLGLQLVRDGNGPVAMLNDYHYSALMNAEVGSLLLREFSPDWLCKRYRPLQRSLCSKHGISPSAVVFLATGGADFNEFSKDGVCNRICLSRNLETMAFNP